jgi:hypothetical protein
MRNGPSQRPGNAINFSDFLSNTEKIHLMAPGKNKIRKVGVFFEPQKVTVKTPR